MHVRGLKRFCSVRGGKAQEYVDISRLADDAMGKIGQIRLPLIWRDAEMVSMSDACRLEWGEATRGGHAHPISRLMRRIAVAVDWRDHGGVGSGKVGVGYGW